MSLESRKKQFTPNEVRKVERTMFLKEIFTPWKLIKISNKETAIEILDNPDSTLEEIMAAEEFAWKWKERSLRKATTLPKQD